MIIYYDDVRNSPDGPSYIFDYHSKHYCINNYKHLSISNMHIMIAFYGGLRPHSYDFMPLKYSLYISDIRYDI